MNAKGDLYVDDFHTFHYETKKAYSHRLFEMTTHPTEGSLLSSTDYSKGESNQNVFKPTLRSPPLPLLLPLQPSMHLPSYNKKLENQHHFFLIILIQKLQHRHTICDDVVLFHKHFYLLIICERISCKRNGIGSSGSFVAV